MPEQLFIPVTPDKDDRGELAIRLESPKRPAEAPFSVLYLHGFGSSQDGDKAAFFRSRFAEKGIPFCSFDFRGHGQSGGSMETLTISRCLEDTRVARSLLERRGAELETHLVDLEGVRFPLRIPDHRRLTELAQLNASLGDDVPDALRCRAFARYAAALPFRGGAEEALRRVVEISLQRNHRWRGAECDLARSVRR